MPTAHAPPRKESSRGRIVGFLKYLSKNTAKCLRILIKAHIRSLLDRLRPWTSRQRCQTRPSSCLNSSITPWICPSPHLEVTEANGANCANGTTTQPRGAEGPRSPSGKNGVLFRHSTTIKQFRPGNKNIRVTQSQGGSVKGRVNVSHAR